MQTNQDKIKIWILDTVETTTIQFTAFKPAYSLRPVPLAELQALTNAAQFGQTPGY